MRTIRILIIDDEVFFREELFPFHLRQIFSDQADVCLDIKGAATAAEGLYAAMDLDFDLLLIDYRLPGANGIEIIEELCKQSVPGARVFLSSAADEVMRPALEAGAHSVICKHNLREKLRPELERLGVLVKKT